MIEPQSRLAGSHSNESAQLAMLIVMTPPLVRNRERSCVM
jgi:hypothetical protein